MRGRNRPVPKRSARRRALLVVMTVAALAASATGVASTLKAGAGSTFVVRTFQDYTNFNLLASTTNSNTPHQVWAYDRLLAYGAGWKLLPYLATSWKASPAARPKQVTFKIRKGATCADGTPVTALTVLNSFKALITVPKTQNFLVDYWGPGPYQVSADRYANTFTFKTLTPFGDLLAGFANPGASIICPAGLAAYAADPHALDEKMYGSGPYELVSATHGDRTVFRLRPEWKWGPNGTTAKDLPREVVVRIVTDHTTAANLLLAGEINHGYVLGDDIKRLEADRTLHETVGQNYYFTQLAMNQRPGRLTTDEKLRQALIVAVDRKSFQQAGYAGEAVDSPGFLVPGMRCYDASVVKKYAPPSGDLDKARQLLRTAGYTLRDGKLYTPDGKPVRLHVSTSTAQIQQAGSEYIQYVFNQLGIDVDLVLDNTRWRTDVLNGNFDVAVINSTYPTPSPSVTLYHVSGPPTERNGRNRAWTGAGDPTLEQAARGAVQTTGARSCKFYNDLVRILLQKNYVVGLGAAKYHYFTRGARFVDNFGGSVAWVEPWALRMTGR